MPLLAFGVLIVVTVCSSSPSCVHAEDSNEPPAMHSLHCGSHHAEHPHMDFLKQSQWQVTYTRQLLPEEAGGCLNTLNKLCGAP